MGSFCLRVSYELALKLAGGLQSCGAGAPTSQLTHMAVVCRLSSWLGVGWISQFFIDLWFSRHGIWPP